MTVKELIKQLKMVQKIHEWKEIQVKIWTIEKWEVKEKDLILQNIVESNYDGKTTIILTNY
jgi:hypothetical protein